MNRRGFFARCLAGAVLGLARNLPLPAAPKPVLDDPPMTATEINRRWESIWLAGWGSDNIIDLLDDLPMVPVSGDEPHTFKLHTKLPELFPRDR